MPTHEDGSCLFWEFATDYYDIGFGLYFEWTVDTSNQVSVQVGESSDEEDEEPGLLVCVLFLLVSCVYFFYLTLSDVCIHEVLKAVLL